jgi:prepilin-type N-terminal cleavage/methylation domain-containing protein
MRLTARTNRSGGFSLVELLVVIVIIAVLIGIAAPAFLSARRNASKVATETVMNSIVSAIDQFENDFGYLPPLILDDPSVAPIDSDWATSVMSRTDAAEKLREERYHSLYSLSVYLVGVGELAPEDPSASGSSATDPARHDGVAGAGFRDPGIDRAWGGAIERTPETHRVRESGQTYGPYLSVAEGEMLRTASVASNDFPEDEVAQGVGGERPPWERMSVILDGYGNPIRYYRYWPLRAEGQTGASLLDAPAELVAPDALRNAPADAMTFDASLDPELQRGAYALLSAGPDDRFAPPSFAVQGANAEGWVSDFLMLSDSARRSAFDFAFDDNIRIVR